MGADEPVRVGIFGAGRLGSALATALVAAGEQVKAVSSRTVRSAEHLATALGAGVAVLAPQAVADSCDLVFLTVPDAAIAALASEIRWRQGQWVVHCSGALDLGPLSGAVRQGALVGCLHPLQSFPSREGGAARFRGITCGVEGSNPLGRVLEELVGRLGASVVRLEGVDRAAYHAAAVFASNDVVALMAAAREAWTLAGLSAASARTSLVPLLLGAAQNVAEHDLRDALTGPVARGDVDTVRRHLAVLGDSELGALYRRLGAELLTLDLPHDAATSSALRDAFAAGAG
ncbi:MAG TPA: DUF2520 domain-containing protein [Dehalococcoidia bacterium]|nr:DUF2520 domain-containing protein [Dehalococcoidia bacterium]